MTSESPQAQNGLSLEDRLLNIHQAAQQNIEQSVMHQAAQLGKLLQLDLDIKTWENRIHDRPEVNQLIDGRRGLAFGIYSAATGAYGQAYGDLRTFLELCFAAVYFSVNELERRRWSSDRLDFSWSRALDDSEGILSKTFVQEFNPDALTEAQDYARKAIRCYRHCSQFIHGKAVATASLPEVLSYDPVVLTTWTTFARDAAESVLFLLFCRYGDELLPTDHGQLATTLEHNFLHLKSVQRKLGMPVEGADG